MDKHPNASNYSFLIISVHPFIERFGCLRFRTNQRLSIFVWKNGPESDSRLVEDQDVSPMVNMNQMYSAVYFADDWKAVVWFLTEHCGLCSRGDGEWQIYQSFSGWRSTDKVRDDSSEWFYYIPLLFTVPVFIFFEVFIKHCLKC